MTSLATMRRFGPWLLGLFLLAQIAGVVPLVYAHTLHEHGNAELASQAQVNINDNRTIGRDAHHQGIDGESDECCVLHHGLVGILPHMIHVKAAPLGHAVVDNVDDALVDIDLARLDRPPRPLPLS